MMQMCRAGRRCNAVPDELSLHCNRVLGFGVFKVYGGFCIRGGAFGFVVCSCCIRH